MPIATRSRIRGVTLIELLVGMAVGIIVVSALVAFIVSSVQANSENLRSIRLTQELRALTEVVGREIRRARYVPAADLLDAVGVDPLPMEVTRFGGVVVLDNGVSDCIEFTYGTDGGPIIGLHDGQGEGRRFWLDTNDNRIWGSRVLYGVGTPTPALTAYCTGGTPAGAVAISSPEIRITAFELGDPAVANSTDQQCFNTDATNSSCNIVDLQITGEIGPPDDTISRTFGQRIRIRSSANPP
jgi:type II secretory pathway pseudopilin PulG